MMRVRQARPWAEVGQHLPLGVTVIIAKTTLNRGVRWDRMPADGKRKGEARI